MITETGGSANVMPSWKYRKYMVDNADTIRAINFNINIDPQDRGKPNQYSVGDHRPPYLHTSIYDKQEIPGIPNNVVRDRFSEAMASQVGQPPIRSVSDMRKICGV